MEFPLFIYLSYTSSNALLGIIEADEDFDDYDQWIFKCGEVNHKFDDLLLYVVEAFVRHHNMDESRVKGLERVGEKAVEYARRLAEVPKYGRDLMSKGVSLVLDARI